MSSIIDRFKRAYDVFFGRDAPNYPGYGVGANRPDRHSLRQGNTKSIVTSVYNQIAVDVALVDIRHVRVDENGNYKETLDDSLNRVLQKEANIDQTGREFIKDITISMFDEGAVAAVPVVTDFNPRNSESFKVLEARVGKITAWYPQDVRVEVYNELIGKKQEIVVPKASTPIFENPFYMTMNEPNGYAQRLLRVLNQLDRTNEQNSAGKIDLLVQLPYAVRGKLLSDKAEERRQNLENQLTGSQYGIGYIDASEKVIQLNRSVENNLWAQAQELMMQFYNQLGFTESIFNGTADEATMLNYYNRTINPVLITIVEEIERKWLSRTAVSQGQRIKYFNDPFRLVPVSQMAEISDKFTRNEIMSSNELRGVLGMYPSKDPKADELRNANLNHPDEASNTQVNNPEIDEVIKDLDSEQVETYLDI